MTEPWKQKVDLFRKRFGAREDVFTTRTVISRPIQDSDTGTWRTEESASFMPVCENFGDQKICRIARNEGGCSGCPHRVYAKLTDDWVWKHISGTADLVLHLLQPGGIKFGACDFDYGAPFEDAKAVKDASWAIGLPCYIARSSKKGYHVYWFFTDLVPAHHFTSLITHLFESVGFLERYRANMAVPLPETFPKQTNYEVGRLGNGIKIPMIEPKFKEGFNCWVDDEAVPYPAHEQWDRLKVMKEITPAELETVIQTGNVKILESPVGRSGATAKRNLNGERVNEPTRQFGDFLQVVEHCKALRQFWEKDVDGTYKFDKTANEKGVPHTARVASLAFARSTKNGLDIIRERWPGPRTEKEIEYGDSSNQHPWTCAAMQERGLCRVNMHPLFTDHCFKKTPPKEKINGIWVENPNGLPETAWSDPSPQRFASGQLTKEQILLALSHIATNRKDYEDTKLHETVESLLKRTVRLGPAEKEEIAKAISSYRILPAKEIKDITKRATKEANEEELKVLLAKVPSREALGNHFTIEGGGYKLHAIDQRGVPQEKELTNFTIEVLEETVVINIGDDVDPSKELQTEERYYRGAIHVNGKHILFNIQADTWMRSADSFFSFLINMAGVEVLYNRSDFDHIRNCLSAFSLEGRIIRNKVKDFGHYKIKGEHTYITPDVIITSDSIAPNTQYQLEFADDVSRPLNFRIIDDAQFKDLATHIINDFFGCNHSIATMTAFAHAMAAGILSHLPLHKSPVLWINGSFSSGKSFVAEMAQCFYGNFGSVLGMNSTGRGKLVAAHNFRDALFVIDDFKGSLSDRNTREMIEFIQSAYDRSGRAASTRDGKVRPEATRVRGLVTTTGEDYPIQEASAISRMLIADIGNNGKNIECGDRVKCRKHEYSGFTPHFIQFVYHQQEADIHALYKRYFAQFEVKMREGQLTDSGHRIAENLAFNMTAFALAMELLVAKGVIPRQRHDELCQKHLVNLEIIRSTICTSVSSQKGAALFLDYLAEILQDPARYHVIGWPGFDPVEHKNSKAIGFYRAGTRDPKEKEVVYIYSKVAHGEIEMMVRKNRNYLQTLSHIGRQLQEDGHIPPGMYDPKSQNFTRQITTPMGNRMNTWAIKLEAIGLTPAPLVSKTNLSVAQEA
jgi:hypothetical protein